MKVRSLMLRGAGLLLLALILASCTGKDGSSYQKLWWAGSLGYLYDTNPATPNPVYNNVYYPTGAGTFYVQYQAFDGSQWYAYYTITVNPGKALLQDGDDLWFELDLYSFGPSLYKWTTARAAGSREAEAKAAESALSGSPGIGVEQAVRPGTQLGPVLGTETYATSVGKVVLTYGQVVK